MTADTQEDCRRDFKPSPCVLRGYAKDMDKDTRLIDGDIAPYLRKVAAWIEQQTASRPSAAGDVVERVATAIQLEDAECFPTLNLKKRDYAIRLAKAAIAAMQPAPLNVEELVREIRKEVNESPADDDYERGCNAGMHRAIALIRKLAHKERTPTP